MLREMASGEVDVADEEGGRWISFQCNYFFGQETDRQRFQRISVWMPCYYFNHCTLVAVIYEGGEGELKQYR
jgi:hypothetical protein